MPQYEYFCHACKKAFSKTLTLAEYQAGKVACPNCRTQKVEQTVASFYAVTSKKERIVSGPFDPKGGRKMSGAKLVVMYPRPTDIEHFEKIYMEEHIPMAIEKLTGKSKLVATKALDLPNEMPPFYRIAEIHFPSMEALNACVSSQAAQETIADAESISTGGKPIFLIAEEETLTFTESTEAAA